MIGQPNQSLPERHVNIPPYIVQVRHFSIEQGLPNRSVTSIGQDAQGFIWIGTLNNAYRFDGSRFIALPTDSRPSQKQLPVYVENISPDQNGSLWFFKARSNSDQWLEKWLPNEQKLIPFTRPTNPASTGQYFPVDMIGQKGLAANPGSPLLVFQENGHIYRYNGKSGLTLVYKPATSSRMLSAVVSPGGTFLLSISDSTIRHHTLVELDSLGRLRRKISVPKALRPVCVDAQGNRYFCQIVQGREPLGTLPRLTSQQLTGFLYRLDTKGRLTDMPIRFDRNLFPRLLNGQSYSLASDQIVYDQHHDLFWFLGKRTLFAWHPSKGILYDLAASDFPASEIPVFGNLRIDKTGGIWVGSNNGILLLTLTPNRFTRYLYRFFGTIESKDVATRGLMQVGNLLWANAVHSWLIDLNTGVHKKAFPDSRALLDQHSIALAGNGSLWTARDSLALVQPTNQTVQKYPLFGLKNECWAIQADGRKNLWLGYNQGLSYFDVTQKRNLPFTRYNAWPELAENRVNGFFPDSRVNGYWVATSSGLYVLDTLKGIVARYSVEQPTPNYLPFNHITYVHIDPDQPGLYWLATRGGGLIRWERATGMYRQYTQADGLLNTTLYCIYTDHPEAAKRRNKNRLWLTTDYGLVSFDKRTRQFQTYLPKDGTTHEEFNFTSHYQASDGRLYLGGLNGITAFWPNQIQTSAATRAPLVITQFQQLDGQTGIMTDHMAEYKLGQPIHIASSSRAFLLSFALLDYRFLGQTRLWYRIRNWQDAWATQRSTDLRINGLPPGEYQLDVREQNINGQWVSGTLSVSIVIQPPVYRRWWFMLLCLLGTIGGTFAIFRWRNRRLVQETIRLEAVVANRTAQIKGDKAIIEQQAAELRENVTLKSRFFANVTHEFRTPLTLLLGPLSYLKKRNTDPTNQRLLSTMERNARQLQELVNDLLGLGKLEAGQLQLDSQPADFRAVVARTVSAFATQASFAGITLTTSGLEQPIGMLIDVQKLETVLRNLIANALHFTSGGGSITVCLTDTIDQVRLAVTDTGRGIHPDDLPHVMERYYQSNRPDAPLQGGTGIGLALCQEYCQLWQGELTVDSTLGRGSVFAFTYPKIAALLVSVPTDVPEIDTLQVREPVLSTEPTADQERILIVEDNPDMAAYIQMLLASQYAANWCRNGQEALSWLAGQPTDALPHLILTDMMMPEMDGMALLSALRQQPQLRPIPVIMLTARFNREVRLKALQLGVADYLTKPFDEDELLTRVQNLLERAREQAFWAAPAADEADETPEKGTPQPDDNWLQRIQSLVIANLADNRFQVTDLADASNMSQRQFYRRLKSLTGLSPIQFVQEVRLQTAYEWIEEDRYKTVKEVAHRVGFQKVSYFSRLYQQRFGVYPSLQINEQSDAVT